jgi:hypothetical protein
MDKPFFHIFFGKICINDSVQNGFVLNNIRKKTDGDVLFRLLKTTGRQLLNYLAYTHPSLILTSTIGKEI